MNYAHLRYIPHFRKKSNTKEFIAQLSPGHTHHLFYSQRLLFHFMDWCYFISCTSTKLREKCQTEDYHAFAHFCPCRHLYSKKLPHLLINSVSAEQTVPLLRKWLSYTVILCHISVQKELSIRVLHAIYIFMSERKSILSI